MAWKVLVVGLGQIGLRYDLDKPDDLVETHARAFHLHPSFSLSAGFDPDPSNRALLEKRYRAPSFSELGQACAQVLPDVVVIASPTPMHLSNLKNVLGACRPSVVLMEKPAAYSRAEAVEMAHLARVAGVPVLMNFIRRTDPAVREIGRRISAGEIELSCKGVVWYGKGIIHSGCHFTDLMASWLGGFDSMEVLGQASGRYEHDLDIDVHARFGESEVYFLAPGGRRTLYYGADLLFANGKLVYGSAGRAVRWEAHSAAGSDPGSVVIADGLSRYQLNVVADLAAFLDRGETCLPTLEDHIANLTPVYTFMEGRAG